MGAAVRVQDQPPELVLWGVCVTPLGEVVAGVTDEGELARVSFTRGRKAELVVRQWQKEWAYTHFEPSKLPKAVLKWPLVVIGTELQRRAWVEIMRIPKGKLATYGEVAELMEMPGRARAVGRACKMCCHAYVIPCHRVVAANGIGGFGGEGPEFKAELLALEGVKTV
jgi:O-6-methylguanine DNA methyltransferase